MATKKLEVEVYSEIVNSPVIRLPYRNYPGVLIQGDSLALLWIKAKKTLETLERLLPNPEENSEDEEALETARELFDSLDGYDTIYRRTLGMPDPPRVKSR